MLFPGVALNGRYLLEELIAMGGMGEVWRGVDPALERSIAVKVLLPSLVADAEFITRFRSEARMMAALRHPGIVQVYDYGQDVLPDGRTMDYLVMELIDGTPLSVVLQEAGTLDPRRVMEIVTQAAEALQVAHEAGIVHRDVKPSNLLIRPGGEVVLVDLGLARSTTAAAITGTNVIMGTANYMAPEQAEGRPVTAAADVYALGAVAYCCLAGRTPYAGDGPMEVLDQLVRGPSPTLPPGVPPAVAAVVTRAMAKDPARRHPSAVALAEAARSALESIVSTGEPTSVVRPPVARVAFLGHDIPGPTTSGHAAEPAATGHGDDQSGNRKGTPARTGRRLLRTVAVLALGVVIGAVWATFNLISSLTDDAADDAAQGPPGSEASIRPSASPDGNRPGPPNGHPSTPSSRKASTSDAPISAAPSLSTAAGDPVTSPGVARELCGSGFEVADSAPLRSADTQLGTVYLLADETGARCVVTLKVADSDEATPVSAYLDLDDGRRRTDGGDFKSYAGPVRETIVDPCVQWGGTVDGVSFDSPPCQ